MDYLQLLGKKIRALRESLNMSQETLAELSNLSPRHIVNIEKGVSQPSYKTLNNIAAALDVAVPTLLDNDYYDSPDILKEKILKKLNKLNEKNLRYLYIVASKLD